MIDIENKLALQKDILERIQKANEQNRVNRVNRFMLINAGRNIVSFDLLL